ncbi:BBE domain-containing protein [Streptomyces sp. NPDC052042]|uniref:BBE domain-containing protein n=1 Tax=Streptomyces sp. NPDC052042 TaxID=3365683 RepID=UPI0037D97428
MGEKRAGPGYPDSAAETTRTSTGPAEADLPDGSIVQGDARYDTLRQGFNQRFSSNPKYIQLIENENDATAQLNRLLADGRRPTVRSGGHCYEGFVDNSGGVILDLSTMSGVYKGADVFGKPTYVVEGGATNWDIYTTLFRKYGRVVPGGSCYSVGAGGHICGGGYGLLSRKHGLTVDHLVQVDVVTVRNGAEAEVTKAHKNDKDPHKQDLFWAHTGGGGGNFGIVLRYHFAQLPEPPQNVWLSSIAWPWKDLPEKDFKKLLENFGQFFATEGTKEKYWDLFSLLHLTHHSNGNITLVSQWGQDDNRPLLDFIEKIEDGMGTPSTHQLYTAADHHLPYPEKHRKMPWFQATMALNSSGPNQRGKYKSAYHRKPFTTDQISALWKWLKQDVQGAHGKSLDLTQTLVQIDSYGGKINTRKPEETAVPQRDSIMKLQYQTYWTDEANDQHHLTYLRELYTDVYAATGGVPEINSRSGRADDRLNDTTTDGAYVNYPDTDLGTADHKAAPAYTRLYYGQNYERLQKVKKYWDPKNHFHHAQSILLPRH